MRLFLQCFLICFGATGALAASSAQSIAHNSTARGPADIEGRQWRIEHSVNDVDPSDRWGGYAGKR